MNTPPRIPLHYRRAREWRIRWAFFGAGVIWGLCFAAVWVAI